MTLRTLIGPLFAFLLVSLSPSPALASAEAPSPGVGASAPVADPPAAPAWLTSLRASKQEQPQHVDRIAVPQPVDSKAGYWTVTHERQPAETKQVPVRSLSPDVDTPAYRTVTTPDRIIHYWSWVEEHAPYQGNTDSLIVHQEGCRYWDCANCTQYFTTFKEAVDLGYRACGICKPEEDAE